METKRKLTDAELREWGNNLSGGNDWDGVDADMIYEIMKDTAGNAYDAGETDWDFDESDAERLLALVNELGGADDN